MSYNRLMQTYKDLQDEPTTYSGTTSSRSLTRGETMENILNEIKAVLRFYGLPEDSVEQFERILLSQVEENKEEVQDYIDSL